MNIKKNYNNKINFKKPKMMILNLKQYLINFGDQY